MIILIFIVCGSLATFQQINKYVIIIVICLDIVARTLLSPFSTACGVH